MKLLALGALALALAGCADGAFKSPLEMTAAERCANVLVAKQIAENHDWDTSAYDADISLFCQAEAE